MNEEYTKEILNRPSRIKCKLTLMFSHIIEQEMKNQKLSISDLAKKMDVPEKYIQNVLYAKHDLTLTDISTFMSVLKMNNISFEEPNSDIIIKRIPQDDGGGFCAYYNYAKYHLRGDGENPKEALENLLDFTDNL